MSSEKKVLDWHQAFQRNVDWEKDDLLTIIYWGRQILGILVGLLFGLFSVTGFLGFAGFAAINGLVMFIYYTKYLKVDDESMGRFDLLSEGFMSSFALFLISWILVYTLLL
eukprot:TRINITY_DN10550_c0_g1_i1.p1 TRINITY_DN10550_c0_g1~~TRINITY_DN10550_c0_g1_i1.p1  ORF type:complete len:111 (-),score=26.88 TRINITY_DN10550_c0_g1_i1:314-646(-)